MVLVESGSHSCLRGQRHIAEEQLQVRCKGVANSGRSGEGTGAEVLDGYLVGLAAAVFSGHARAMATDTSPGSQTAFLSANLADRTASSRCKTYAKVEMVGECFGPPAILRKIVQEDVSNLRARGATCALPHRGTAASHSERRSGKPRVVPPFLRRAEETFSVFPHSDRCQEMSEAQLPSRRGVGSCSVKDQGGEQLLRPKSRFRAGVAG